MSDLGLSTAEASRRLVEIGPNEIRQRRRVSVVSGVAAQLRDPLILVLLAACVLTVVTGDWPDSVVIALVVVVNTTVGVVQELRADQAITALAQLSSPYVRVRRDGTEVSVASSQLVPGDVVLLGEGDIVPADCLVLEASSLLVDESALTGESVAVGKAGPHGESAGEGLSSGTVVVKGRAVAEVTRTGTDSALGRIAALTDTRARPTPLQVRLARLGRVLAAVVVGLSTVVLTMGLLHGEPLELMIVTAISLAVAAVPESLPAVVSLGLAVGARRMAAHNAIIRRLSAVETLGSVTMLATDKTGTLTQAQMLVEQLWTPKHLVGVLGDGYEPVGELVSSGLTADLDQAPDVVELVRAVVLCNDATLVPPSEPGQGWTGLGDPTEVALLTLGGKVGLERAELEGSFPRVDEIPFDSTSQCMTTVHRMTGTRRLLIVTKGSVEALHLRYGQGRHAAAWHGALQEAQALSAQGFRVLAVTSAQVDVDAYWRQADHRLLGLVAMNDPARPAARSTIAACQTAGMVAILITGDHPATATAVARRVGIVTDEQAGQPGLVVSGPDLAAGRVPDLTAPRVFARATPEQKLQVVLAWQASGAIVAMTGDGVNDGPALRRADIGVAMGSRGTEVARQAADLVLADDDLATVVPAVKEGRRVYDNIRLFLVFGLSGGAAEILVMLLGPVIGLTVPLLAAQILWINLLTHGLTGVALGAEPAAPGVMSRPPRPPDQGVLSGGVWQRVVALSLVIAVTTLAMGAWAHGADRAWQTMVFLSLTSLQLGVALGIRPRQLTTANAFLPAAVLGSLALALAGVYLIPLQQVLETVAIPVADAALAVSVGVVGWVATRVAQSRAI